MRIEEKKPSYLQILFWRFWRGLDNQLIIACGILILLSLLLVSTTSSSVAIRIGVSENYFIKKHIFYVLFSFLIISVFSIFSINTIKRISILFFLINLFFLIIVKFTGIEVKGARRWINLFGFSLQPSEFIKPFFCIMTAYIFEFFREKNFALLTSFIVYALVAFLVIMQPDFGMLVTISGMWGVQLFVAGLAYLYIFWIILIAVMGVLLSYYFLPHVTSRIDSFLNPTIYENYQVIQSIKAFKSGGLFGRGPGEGVIKNNLPDSHADFIFAVAGEEFGIVICILISLIFAFIVLRGLIVLSNKEDEFTILAGAGIISQIAIQSIINMGVALNMLPTKGMTLPFISYGGSSTIAIGLSIGILLALTRAEKLPTKYSINNNNI